jgi:Dihaem cytochrome c
MMQNKFKIMVVLAGALMVNSTYVQAEESFAGWLFNFERTKEIKPVSDSASGRQYQKECGECHFAYQPGLLPSKSWKKLLTPEALHDHFGESAEMDKATLQGIYDYAVDNAAEKSYYKRARKIAVATAEGEAPIRITKLRYIERKHQDIPEKMIKGNKDVKSLSYCDACHTQAAKGVFDDSTVSIPNYPDWD